MDYKFEKFEGRNSRQEERITITKSNSIGFPTKFYNDNGIKNFKYAVLFWDKENKVIGIHFTNEEGKNGFTIGHSKQGYGGGVVATSFFKSYNIDPKSYYGRYTWEKHTLENVGKIFAIKLKSTVRKE
jgi:hypothetical protein